MRRLIFTLSMVNAVLNMMVIGIFMPDEVITVYSVGGSAAARGSRWFFAVYVLIPLVISGVFLLTDIVNGRGKNAQTDDEEISAVDEFLSGKSRKSDNADILLTWFFAVISWVMTGLALNDIENIGVIMPSIIVVMISAFVIFTSALYSGGDKIRICGVDVKWLDGETAAFRRTQRLSMLLGVMSGMIGVCLAAWSLVVNNNLPNCIAVAEMLLAAFFIPLMYSRSQRNKD